MKLVRNLPGEQTCSTGRAKGPLIVQPSRKMYTVRAARPAIRPPHFFAASAQGGPTFMRGLAGEISTHAGMIEAGWRTPSAPTRSTARPSYELPDASH